MALNLKHEQGKRLQLAVASGVLSGAPLVVGQIPGVALTDRQTDGTASVQMEGVFNLAVGGVDGSGNAAVAIGDVLYFTNADTPKLNKKTTGVRFGYALGAVASGGSGTIEVKVGY